MGLPMNEHITPWGKVWTHGADVMKTFKQYGFVPPSEYRNDFLFRINRENGRVQDPDSERSGRLAIELRT